MCGGPCRRSLTWWKAGCASTLSSGCGCIGDGGSSSLLPPRFRGGSGWSSRECTALQRTGERMLLMQDERECTGQRALDADLVGLELGDDLVESSYPGSTRS